MANRRAEVQAQNRPATPWSSLPSDLLRELSVDRTAGLSLAEVEERTRIFGPNTVQRTKKVSVWDILVRQLRSIIVGLLAIGAILSFALGEQLEGIAIVAVIVINTAIGFFTELKAVRSTEALRSMGTNETTVRRDSVLQRVPSSALVPGDVALFEGGDVVTADVRLMEASRVQVDESALTGESVPVSKSPEPLPPPTLLADRANMLFKGTAITRGNAEGVVTFTGLDTELGHITSLVEEVHDVETPLEKRTHEFGRILAWLCLAFVALVAVAGVVSGKDLGTVLRTAIALAIATVPEGLPIVATLALARGVLRMARRDAVVEELSAVEALGSTSVIFTDKTGTLTENQMKVSHLTVEDGSITPRTGLSASERQLYGELIAASVLCTEAAPDSTYISDPMEAALIRLGAQTGFEHKTLLEEKPRVGEDAFDPQLKLMATFHRSANGTVAMVKGAPEAVFDACSSLRSRGSDEPFGTQERSRWDGLNEELAGRGLRVLAVATKKLNDDELVTPYGQLTLLGLVGLLDPPRADIREAITQCRDAGIEVVMVTGDQALTAESIAKAVGVVAPDAKAHPILGAEISELEHGTESRQKRLLRTRIFARTDPAQKLQLLQFFESQGETVAMIGDGVNDAPALKQAAVGVAMGKRGTQVAREAADIVLRDDNFGTIVAAIEEGRVIFRNLRTFVVYLLSCNMSEILTVGIASVFNAPLPILPLQILFLNLVTDVFPALALGMGEGDPNVMSRPPRNPDEGFLTKQHWWRIVGFSLLITIAVLTGLAVALLVLKMDVGTAVTVSFLILAFGQLAHVFNMVGRRSGFVLNEITRNPWIWAALLLCVGLLVASVYAPGLSTVLDTKRLSTQGWLLVAGLSLAPLLIGQLIRLIRNAVSPPTV